MQDDLEVTGISRSGRVRKKSSKLMDFESLDDIETRLRRTPVKAFVVPKEEPLNAPEFQESVQPGPVEEAGTASGSESDFSDNPGENADSMDTDSSDDAGAPPASAGVANSLYMMEKSSKKKLIIKDGRVVGRAKAQRKDKGKSRMTAYMLWAKEARNELLKKYGNALDFSSISKRLGQMWANVNYNERYLWKRKARRLTMQSERRAHDPAGKIISSTVEAPPPPRPGPGRPPGSRAARASLAAKPPASAHLPVSSAGPSSTSPQGAAGAQGAAGGHGSTGVYRVAGCGAAELAAHLRLLGESLAIIGERLKEHEGQIAVSGSVSVLLDTLLCSLAPLLGAARAVPAIAPPARLLRDTLHNIAYIMPGL